MRAVVYRMYDADYRLLYVGHSINAIQRLQGHASTAAWFEDIDTITVEHFDTVDQAQTAEREAIAAEQPAHNVNHTKRPRRKREPVDRSTWRAEGLRINPAFFVDGGFVGNRDRTAVRR